MFQWDKSITSLEIPVGMVVHLFRSMRDVQLALPGLPAQEASAFLCQYQGQQGVGTIAVFHLHKSNQLAFYADTPREVPASKAENVLDQAQVFVESMGFLMTDLDIHLLGESDREMLWSSLPIRQGVQPVERKESPKPAPVVAAREVAAPAKSLEKSVLADIENIAAPAVKPVVATAEAGKTVEKQPASGENGEQGNVDDLLAAVEALRTRRPGVRSRKKAPSPEELRRRRQELRDNLGRILASL